MQKTKTIGKLSKGQTKDKENRWKSKAIVRRKEVDRLNKRLKEVIESRDSWKGKYKLLKKSSSNSNTLLGEKAARHRYSLTTIVLIIALYKYGGMSLRSCRHSLCCMFVALGLNANVPSHSSIRNWLCKCGMYRTNNKRDDVSGYVVYVDESISFGSEKMLLILGVPLEDIPTERSLSHDDMEVLFVGASQEWKGEHIEEELLKIAANHAIAYVVSDQGNNLRKAYKLLNYTHIEDCTHILANILKKIYNKDETFETFRKLIGKLRRDWNLSKNKSRYMPPTMRGKMRFANIFPCVNWAKKILIDWEDLSEEVQSKLNFLKEHKDFIETLIQIETVFKTVCAKLKNKGFGQTQKQELLKQLAEIEPHEKTDIFIQKCKDYLDNLTLKSKILKYKHLLCSSDIIESFFGKFKAKVNSNSRSGLTEFIYTIATFGKPFSNTEVKKALESIQCKDLVLIKRPPKTA